MADERANRTAIPTRAKPPSERKRKNELDYKNPSSPFPPGVRDLRVPLAFSGRVRTIRGILQIPRAASAWKKSKDRSNKN